MKYSSLFVVVFTFIFYFFCLQVYYRLYNFHLVNVRVVYFSHSFTLDLLVCFRQLSLFSIRYEWLSKSIKALILVEGVMQEAQYFSPQWSHHLVLYHKYFPTYVRRYFYHKNNHGPSYHRCLIYALLRVGFLTLSCE